MTGAISQDWESCQFPFVLDEKPTFVPGGSAGEGSGGKRVPFVGSADSKRWLAMIDALLALQPRVMVPGHGAASGDPAADLAFTRDYLRHLRAAMGKAVAEMQPFEEAYRLADWSRYEKMPAFGAANRINAYGTYLLLEQESLGNK